MPLSTMDRSSSQKIIKETLGLNYIVDKMDLTNIYNIPHNCSRIHILFKCTWNSLQDRSHAGHKASLGKFKKTEIISSIFSDHNAMRLEINYKKKTAINTNMWRLKNMLLNNQWVTEEIKEEIKKYLETNENENTTIQNLWDAAKAVLRGKFIAIQAYLRKQVSNKQPNLTSKATMERRTNKTQS